MGGSDRSKHNRPARAGGSNAGRRALSNSASPNDTPSIRRTRIGRRRVQSLPARLGIPGKGLQAAAGDMNALTMRFAPRDRLGSHRIRSSGGHHSETMFSRDNMAKAGNGSSTKQRVFSRRRFSSSASALAPPIDFPPWQLAAGIANRPKPARIRQSLHRCRMVLRVNALVEAVILHPGVFARFVECHRAVAAANRAAEGL